MKILQQPVKLKRHSRVKINFSQPTNVYLMTEVNYKRYKEGASFKRLGGKFDNSPAEFTAPYDGTWHAVIEKGSHFKPMKITGSVEILPPLMKDNVHVFDEDEVTPAKKSIKGKKSSKSDELEQDDQTNEVES